ncbi:hypothetical protein HZS_5087 [Henneguya salminicola]|nr:hypothetical protein HZS_5087 [Henneguya salminicola]
MLSAVAFIKEDNVIQAWQEHICLNGFEKQSRELLNYYEDAIIGKQHLKNIILHLLAHLF